MQKSLKSQEYGRFVELLVHTRKATDMRQDALAKKLGKPQSFVAKYEGGERRIDVIEFIAICHALGVDPIKTFRKYIATSAQTANRGEDLC